MTSQPGTSRASDATARSPQRRTLREREQGQSILEIAFVLPILILLIAVVIDAARAFDAYIVITNAAREGARYGALDKSLDPIEIKQLVVDDVLGSGTNISHMEDFSLANVTVTGMGGTDKVTVSVAYDLRLWFGGIAGLDYFHLYKQAVMPVY
jgi:Flp pilus assembly protein TadG